MLQSVGFETIASGDSHNDLGMIQASKAGFLFRTTDQIKADYPQLEAFEEYDDLFEAIKKALTVESLDCSQRILKPVIVPSLATSRV